MTRNLAGGVAIFFVVLGCLFLALGIWNSTTADSDEDKVRRAIGLMALIAGGLLLVAAGLILRGLRSGETDQSR